MSDDIRERADQLAQLMEEFRLEQGKLEGDDWKVAFRKTRRLLMAQPAAGTALPHAHEPGHHVVEEELAPPAVAAKGTPVTSPMTGIYYSAPSPSAPAFVKEGDPVNAGQVVGLIEAMKVFNEIVAPLSGSVLSIVAKNGDVVNPGEPLLYIG